MIHPKTFRPHWKVSVQKTNSSVEQFTITLEPTTAGINVICEMAETRIVIPITE